MTCDLVTLPSMRYESGQIRAGLPLCPPAAQSNKGHICLWTLILGLQRRYAWPQRNGLLNSMMRMGWCFLLCHSARRPSTETMEVATSIFPKSFTKILSGRCLDLCQNRGLSESSYGGDVDSTP